MKRVKIPGNRYAIQVPKDSAFRIDTPDDQIKMHALVFAIAKRGGGKTVALTSLLKSLQRDKALDRLLVISPTWGSNKNMFDGLPVSEDDVYHETDASVVDDIVMKVKKEMDMYTEYTEKMKLRQQMLKALKATHSESDVYKINPQLMIDCFNYDIIGQDPPPHKWGGKRPVMALLVDDAQGSKLFGSAKFQNLCLRHRHLGDGLGLTIMMACQTFKAQTGGMPVAIRDNTTHMLLFPTRNRESLKNVIKEVSDDIGEEEFLSAFDTATKEGDHDFLFVDFHPKIPGRKFRKNFDEYIIPPENGVAAADGDGSAGAGGVAATGTKRDAAGLPVGDAGGRNAGKLPARR